MSDLTVFYQSFETFYTSKYFPTFRMETAVFPETLPSINIQASLIEWLALARLALTVPVQYSVILPCGTT
jgi:hypothetical protein